MSHLKKTAVLMFAMFASFPAQIFCDMPNIILVMADDMGWGQTGYRNHPVLKTPNLDAMAANGLRFERFYAASPVCSPTRASVMTGRSPDRTGVLTHGYALRLQERTVAQAMKSAGYATGHFGKWHLNGFKGPGAPVLKSDPRNPGQFGFDEWLSVTNFFDLNPLMSRSGEVVEMQGDSSEIAVNQALEFIERKKGENRPVFSVIWFGSPHSPFKSLDDDKKAFENLDQASANHYGELVALDRAVGKLRQKLRELKMAENTLVVFCSDNGGLPEIKPGTVGELRGHKSSVYEGGLRVPGIMEWPAVIQPRVTNYPACTYDLFPTIADIVGLRGDIFIQPLDGVSLKPILTGEIAERSKPLGFRFGKKIALIDNRYKIMANDLGNGEFELYDLLNDPKESVNMRNENPELFESMKQKLMAWNDSVENSFSGKDYAGGQLSPPDPPSIFWYESPMYKEYLKNWKDRWEFRSYMQTQKKAASKKKKAG